jgi:hypothetical protein
VKDDDVVTLVSMGFTDKESRLGLRAANGNVDQATNVIIKRREERRQKEQEEKQRRRKIREQKQYGKTAR